LLIKLNDDKELVNRIRQALKDNDGYCPCALERNRDTRCLCKQFREMTEGTCHCGLYVKSVE